MVVAGTLPSLLPVMLTRGGSTNTSPGPTDTGSRPSRRRVNRRLAELEHQVGLRLVHRHPTGYRLTEMGEQLLPS
jgi:hypothetical protein